jgi:hypothetical protein
MNTKDLEIFQKLAEQVATDPGMSREWQCGKFTELAYLCHFVQCYKSSLHIADWRFPSIYIMEDGEGRTGIAFCDLQWPLNRRIDQELKVSDDTTDRKAAAIQELWLVFVAEGGETQASFCLNMVNEHNLSLTFDKIFLFDFFQSTIQVIK